MAVMRAYIWVRSVYRPRLAIAADQQAAITGIGAVFGVGGEAGRAVGVVGGRAAISKDQGLEERAQADQELAQDRLLNAQPGSQTKAA